MITKFKKIFISNTIIYGLFKKIFRRKFLKIEKETKELLIEIENKNDEYIISIVNDKLDNIIRYAKENTIYYGDIFNEFDISGHEDIKRIPLLTKDIIRLNNKDLISRMFNVKDLSIHNTGGSTGKPLYFYSNKDAGYIDNGHHWFLYEKMGYSKGDIIISCGGTKIDNYKIKRNIFWNENDKLNVWGKFDFSSLYLNPSNIIFYIDKILEIKPEIMRGYPSFYAELANYIIENKINIDFKIKGINLTAEMCSLEQRNIIIKAFKTNIYFEYGHSEMCIFSYTDDNNYIYKTSPVYGYVEIIDEQGNDVKNGEIGKVIVTGFNNYGMPFIRYDTGDMAELCENKNGLVTLKRVLGRTQDFVYDKKGNKYYLTALIFGQHLHAFDNISHWQLEQNKFGYIVINLVKDYKYNDSDEQEIVGSFNKVSDFDIKFNYVKEIKKTESGKHLFIKQNVKI